MAKRSRARLEDLEWLREHLEATRRLAPKGAGRDRIARLEDWLVVMIDTRVAQITQPQTEHNKRLVEQYETAQADWSARREHETQLYKTEAAEWEAEHPRPTWTAFLLDQRRRVEAAKACSCPQYVIHTQGCPVACGEPWTWSDQSITKPTCNLEAGHGGERHRVLDGVHEGLSWPVTA